MFGRSKPMATPKDELPSGPAIPPTPVRCPKCSAIEAIPVCNIKSYALGAGGQVLEDHIGFRVACQRCECIYSIVPTGVFRHHRQSSPLTPEVGAPPIETDPAPTGELPPHAQRPVPRERPRV